MEGPKKGRFSKRRVDFSSRLHRSFLAVFGGSAYPSLDLFGKVAKMAVLGHFWAFLGHFEGFWPVSRKFVFFSIFQYFYKIFGKKVNYFGKKVKRSAKRLK